MTPTLCVQSALWIFLVCLASGCASDPKSQDESEDWRYEDEFDEYDRYDDDVYEDGRPGPFTPIDEGRLTMAISVPWLVDTQFDLRGLDGEEWDDAERYEVLILYHTPRDIQVQPTAGFYGYYEEKEWSEGAAQVSHDSVGAGFEVGAFLYPLSYKPRETIDLAFYPHLRLGIGSNTGSFRRIPEPDTAPAPATSSGDLGDFRVEGGFGIDARLVLARRVILGAGIGVTWWGALDTALVSVRDGTGTIVINEDDEDFRGRDFFFRVTFEVAY